MSSGSSGWTSSGSEKDENWHVSAKEARQHVPANVEDDSARCAVWEWALDRKPLRAPHEILQMTEVGLPTAECGINLND